MKAIKFDASPCCPCGRKQAPADRESSHMCLACMCIQMIPNALTTNANEHIVTVRSGNALTYAHGTHRRVLRGALGLDPAHSADFVARVCDLMQTMASIRVLLSWCGILVLKRSRCHQAQKFIMYVVFANQLFLPLAFSDALSSVMTIPRLL